MLSIVIYGGTFCPVHWGHLHAACAVQAHMQCHEFLFLPCKAPVLDKHADASVHDRVAMLKLALNPYPALGIDLSEVERETPSFMCDTLREFRRQRQDDVSLILLLGMDSFLQLPRWHHWEQLLTYAHLMVMERADVHVSFSKPLHRLLLQHETTHKHELLTHSCGKIYRFDAGHYAISSSVVRQAIQQKQDTSHLIPKAVRHYIDTHQLFV